MANVQPAIPAAAGPAVPAPIRPKSPEPGAASFGNALSRAKPEPKPKPAVADPPQANPVAKKPATTKQAARKTTREQDPQDPTPDQPPVPAANDASPEVTPQVIDTEPADAPVDDAQVNPAVKQETPTPDIQMIVADAGPIPPQTVDLPQSDTQNQPDNPIAMPLVINEELPDAGDDSTDLEPADIKTKAEEPLMLDEPPPPPPQQAQPPAATEYAAIPVEIQKPNTDTSPIESSIPERANRSSSEATPPTARPAVVESAPDTPPKQPPSHGEQQASGDGRNFELPPNSQAPERQAPERQAPADSQPQFRIEPHTPSPQPVPLPAADRPQLIARPIAPPAPDTPFADVNHPNIVTAIRTQLLPRGGSMHIRLDPPELGAMQVNLQIRDGVVTASFQTSNDDATRLLSHSLHQLKQSLETQGISVDRLHVEQAPREKFTGGSPEDGGQRQSQDHAAQQEQQRREMLQRMWRRLRGGRDPLDLLG